MNISSFLPVGTVSRLMWAHGDASQPSSDTVDTMMDIVHDYIFDIVSSVSPAHYNSLHFLLTRPFPFADDPTTVG